MIDRFKGEAGRRLLVNALGQQKIAGGNSVLAEMLVEHVQLRQLEAGERLIEENAADNDLYLVLDGTFKIVVKGTKIAERTINDVLGEMAAVDPTMRRSADVIAVTDALVASLSEEDLSKVATVHPEVFKYIAVLMGQKLKQRNDHVRPAHAKMRVFLISSKESMPIARVVHNALSHDEEFEVIPWQEGAFKAACYTLQTLEDEVNKADFAVAIAHADDVIEYREKDWPAPRDNVIFELGLFMGRLGRQRAILLEPRNNKVKLPSDLAGVTTITYRFDKDSRDKQAMLAPACNELRDHFLDTGPRPGV
ncbi:nucleotide-binding protein [Pseudoxanthomonas sp. PXM02]|nr:nucleotide-binding protein [Pseudoxanthomonas sp. PXM02]